MPGLAVLFALEPTEIQTIRAHTLEERWGFLIEEVEEKYFGTGGRYLELAKAWEGLHFIFCDGGWEETAASSSVCTIFGGEFLLGEEEGSEEIITYKSPEMVAQIAAYLSNFSIEEKILHSYTDIPAEDYSMMKNEENQQYLNDWAEGLSAFYQNAAQNHYAVLFTLTL